jgi:hypothetical protein
LKDWQLLRLQPWTCLSWEPSQGHESRLGAAREASDGTGSGQLWIWIWWRPGVKRFKTLEVTERGYLVSNGNFVNTRKINDFFPLQGGFHHSLCHKFSLIHKSKLRDLNSRLGGCEICVLEIYCSNFLKNNEGKKKTKVILSLILRFNLRLGGYFIWSASTLHTIYDQDFEAWAPHSLEATRSTWRTTRRIWRAGQKQLEENSDYLKYSTTPSQLLDTYRTRLRRARELVRPGAAGLLIGIEYSRVRDST